MKDCNSILGSISGSPYLGELLGVEVLSLYGFRVKGWQSLARPKAQGLGFRKKHWLEHGCVGLGCAWKC